jgi:hypothetical protein
VALLEEGLDEKHEGDVVWCDQNWRRSPLQPDKSKPQPTLVAANVSDSAASINRPNSENPDEFSSSRKSLISSRAISRSRKSLSSFRDKSQRMNILGQIVKPGSYLLTNTMTALAYRYGWEGPGFRQAEVDLGATPGADGNQQRIPFNYQRCHQRQEL